MRFMRLVPLLLLLLFVPPALAFELPGLDRDAEAYASALTARHPAGGTPAARRTADQRVDEAEKKGDGPALVTALEARIALGQATGAQWMSLARAQLRRAPPDPNRALQAAWRAFVAAESPAAEVPPLLLMADALRRLDRPAQALRALGEASSRAPEDRSIRQLVMETHQAAGLLITRVELDPESDPPRACVQFSAPLSPRADINPQDWVRFEPPLANAAVTRESQRLCVLGLPSGATTRITLRAGLPGADGLTLRRDTSVNAAMGNRRPRIVFDQRLFILPRQQTAELTLGTVNLSSVQLTLARLSERNIAAFIRDNRLGAEIESWAADNISEETGRVVWRGEAEVPAWRPNQLARTRLPLPDSLAAPGLYALIARPGDGSARGHISATQMILRTDLAPTVWRGSDGLTVQMRGLSDAEPRPGVRLSLLARNNDILAEATTDSAGIARFARPLLRGEGPLEPRAIHAFGPGDDFVSLDLAAPSFDLADRGVAGQAHPGPLDAYVWLDRGIYRPGETVQMMALARDSAGAPVDVPTRVTVRRPNGQVFLETAPERLADAALHAPIRLSPSAPTGIWVVELRADSALPPIGRAEFRVDAFVPDRLAVEIDATTDPLVAGQPRELPVTARFLFGAPGAGLTGSASWGLSIDEAPFPALAGYRIGQVDEMFIPRAETVDLRETDARGRTTLSLRLPRPPDTTRAVKAEVAVTINDPGGRGSRAVTTVPVRPAGPLIGIKPGFADGAIGPGDEAVFDVAAVDPVGARVGMAARLRLVRERPDWRVVSAGGVARYQIVWRDEPLDSQSLAIPAAAPARFARKLDFGRYRLEVAEDGGMALTSVRFRVGWVSAGQPDVPDQVDVAADRPSGAPGESVRLRITPPFGGKATLLVLTDLVLMTREITVSERGTEALVPISADWGPGAYVAVHAYRPVGTAPAGGSSRAIGLVWVGVDEGTRRMPLVLEVPENLPPRAVTNVIVRGAPDAWVSLAVVDEGILRLTQFRSPDPAPYFLGRRRLGVDIRDDWGRLIPPASGEATILRQGGDDGAFVLPETPVRTVTLFVPPRRIGPDGTLAIPLDLPDFAGQVRLMAVAWSGTRIAATAKTALVRDPLIAEPLMPRFLAPGDEASVAVLLRNLELPDGEVSVRLSTDGPLALAGADRLTVPLARGQQAVPGSVIRAVGAGRGVVRLDVTGPGGFAVTREVALTLRSARAPTTMLAGGELAAGADITLDPGADRFVPGTWRARAIIGSPVRYDVAAIAGLLDDYPLRCLEQAASRALPLALLGDDGPLAADRAPRLAEAVAQILDRQRYDGGFALWSAAGEPQPWLSAYATDVLLRARAAGATIPDAALRDALRYLTDETDSASSSPLDLAAQAYRLYVLAKAGKGRPGAARVLAENLNALPTPLARAQLGAALAIARDAPRAEAAFRAALAAPVRRFWDADYGSVERDQFALAVLLKESGVLPDRLADLTGALPGPDLLPARLSTQEQAWAVAAAAVLGRDGRAARISVDGGGPRAATPLSLPVRAPMVVTNRDERPVWQTLSVTGVTTTPMPAARERMVIRRRFLAMDGSALNLDSLKQNTIFVLLLEGKAEDGRAHTLQLLHGLPAGWEIVGRFAEGDATGLPWLGKLSATDAQPAADDRFAAVLSVTAEKPEFRVAVKLRAVTPGVFELPGADLSDMYQPGLFARQAVGRVTVAVAD